MSSPVFSRRRPAFGACRLGGHSRGIPPVMRDGRLLIDGGIYNPVPFDLLDGDADIVIAVDVVGAPVRKRTAKSRTRST